MINTTQAIVRQKLRRDKKQLKNDMKSICKDRERVLDTKDYQDDVQQLEVAVVEQSRPSHDFVFTRWQQRKFMERLNKSKRRGVRTDLDKDLDQRWTKPSSFSGGKTEQGGGEGSGGSGS